MKILFIGSRLFDDVSWYLKRNNITSIVTESNENAANLDLADEVRIVPRGMDAPAKVAIEEDVDAVIPLIGIDPPLISVGKMKEYLETNYNIPVIASNYSTAKLAANKYETKQLLEANGIKTPKYACIDSVSSITSNDYPIVLKTPDGQGGCGVKVAKNSNEASEFIESNTNIFSEEYIEGYEVSIEVLRHNNQTVALQPVYKGNTTLSGTHPLSKIKRAPLYINGIDNQEHNTEIINLTTKIANLVDLDGTMDIDILHDTNTGKDYVIELNTRPSGTRYMSAATSGIYPLCELVDMARGNWSAKSRKKSIKNYYATEIPVGDFDRSNKVPCEKVFTSDNSYIVHGPEHYERLTIRATSNSKLEILTYELANEYATRNNIHFN
ncbi:MAG: ATP-grasp domain-containing protein [Methanosphaera sp.]|nr:ATP-grasp domain-containing protein [Methanosphaera sp.]